MKFIYYYRIEEMGEWAFDSKRKAMQSIFKRCIVTNVEKLDDDTDLIHVYWEDVEDEDEIYLVKIELNKE